MVSILIAIIAAGIAVFVWKYIARPFVMGFFRGFKNNP
jgi:hypothetical protein